MANTNVGTPVKAGNIRVWVTEEGVHPTRAPDYQAVAVPGDPSWSFGEDTPIQVPDPDRLDAWVEAGSVKGAKERPTTSLLGRYPMDVSTFLRLARKQCRLDIYELVGECENPQDFTDGWQKIRYWPDGRISTYSNEGVGALQSDDNAPTNETIELSAREFYEIGQQKFAQIGSSDTVREIIAVDVCDDESCGDCGRSSDGCQRVIALMLGTGATPGTLPSVLYSDDGGSSFAADDISSLFSNEDPSDAACIGGNYFVVVNTSNSLHFVDVDDLMDGVGAWTEVNTGFVVGGGTQRYLVFECAQYLGCGGWRLCLLFGHPDIQCHSARRGRCNHAKSARRSCLRYRQRAGGWRLQCSNPHDKRWRHLAGSDRPIGRYHPEHLLDVVPRSMVCWRRYWRLLADHK